ncbi:hypothetical protein CSOJ01_06237 [Colletotrichum sojae]|uniref:Uncharacterized protein n=1 Tax=Colletotrichum sojae TaxID=2175907 RepID=A0A8H6MW80_9PEZI|nr:hypothetical protein CSOJ01_06237 [Colletotrichum sojae]
MWQRIHGRLCRCQKTEVLGWSVPCFALHGNCSDSHAVLQGGRWMKARMRFKVKVYPHTYIDLYSTRCVSHDKVAAHAAKWPQGLHRTAHDVANVGMDIPGLLEGLQRSDGGAPRSCIAHLPPATQGRGVVGTLRMPPVPSVAFAMANGISMSPCRAPSTTEREGKNGSVSPEAANDDRRRAYVYPVKILHLVPLQHTVWTSNITSPLRVGEVRLLNGLTSASDLPPITSAIPLVREYEATSKWNAHLAASPLPTMDFRVSNIVTSVTFVVAVQCGFAAPAKHWPTCDALPPQTMRSPLLQKYKLCIVDDELPLNHDVEFPELPEEPIALSDASNAKRPGSNSP